MKKQGVFRKNLLMLGYVWDISHSYFYEAFLLIILQVLSNVSFILIVKMVLDILTTNGSFSTIAIYCGFLLLLNVIQQIYSSWFYMKKTKFVKLKVQESMQKRMFQKALELDLSCYESGAFYDQYVKAMPEADNRSMAIFNTMFDFVRNLLNIFSVLVILVTLDAVLILFTIASILVTLFLNNLKNKHVFEYEQKEKDINRQRDYVKRIFYMPEYAKELKLFSVSGRLQDKYIRETQNLFTIIKRYFNKILTFDCATGVATICISVGMILYLSFQVFSGHISTGDFLALERSTGTLTGSLRGVFSVITELKRHSLYIDNYLSFMNYKPQIAPNPQCLQVAPDKPMHYRLNHVWFKYEESGSPILKNINLDIQEGERIAIVGYNGAGKTTLAKLLLRLYDVTEGEIQINNRDIRDYNVKSIWDSVGVVFQDSKYYALSIRDNIVPDGSDYTDQAVEAALDKADLTAKISKLPLGLGTPVSKELSGDGDVFSGGQLQSLFLSRVFLQDAKTLILDEPSSALDPIAEDRILTTMLELSRGKTVIIIAHRLSCIKFVDRILFMENGEICEQGSHDELIRLDGKYAHMYRTQAKNYFKETEPTSV